MMKYLMVLLLLFPMGLIGAVYTLDNNPGSSANYSSASTAVSALASGDTLIVMPSLTSYGSISLTRRIYMYSRGGLNGSYFKIDNDRVPDFFSITCNSGSQKSVIEGLSISGILIMNDNEITARNCYFATSSTCISINSDNNLVEGCVIKSKAAGSTGTDINFTTIADNNIVRNCWFSFFTVGNVNGSNYYFILSGNSSNLISNNLFVYFLSSGSTTSNPFIYFHSSNAKFHNNILWTNETTRTRMDTLSTSATYKNNLTYSVNTTLPNLSGSNNINDQEPQWIVATNNTVAPTVNNTANITSWKLKTSSPGYQKGLDSTDLGFYGGGYNFQPHGNAVGVPIFEDFTILNPVIKQGGTLKIRMRARKPD